MGQYFAAVNTDKKEYVCPWCIGGGAKLWEWAANTTGAIFTLLLRQSSEGGGGDFYGYKPHAADIETTSPDEFIHTIHKLVAMEGRPIPEKPDEIAGRWAGDRVVLVGDYDESKLYQTIRSDASYRNISEPLVETWNHFIELEERQLRYDRSFSFLEKKDKQQART